jgi:hypothetical protein
MQCDRYAQLCLDNFTLAIECTTYGEEQRRIERSRLWCLLTRTEVCRTQSVLVFDGVRVYSVAVPRGGKFYYGFLLIVTECNSNLNYCTSERGLVITRKLLVITSNGNYQRFTCANHVHMREPCGAWHMEG